MEDLERKVKEKLNNIDDMSETILLIRLYSEYENNQERKPESDEFSLIQLRNAVKKISQKMNKVLNQKDYSNLDVLYFVKNKSLMLDDCLANIDIEDKAGMQNVINLVTELESLLSLPLSFPFNVENCLKEHLGIEMEKTFSR